MEFALHGPGKGALFAWGLVMAVWHCGTKGVTVLKVNPTKQRRREAARQSSKLRSISSKRVASYITWPTGPRRLPSAGYGRASAWARVISLVPGVEQGRVELQPTNVPCFRLPIPLGMDLLLMPGEHVLRHDVADCAGGRCVMLDVGPMGAAFVRTSINSQAQRTRAGSTDDFSTFVADSERSPRSRSRRLARITTV